MMRQRLAWGALIVGVALLIYSFLPGYGPQETWFEGATAVLNDPNLSVTAVNARLQGGTDTTVKSLPFKASADDGTISVDLTGLAAKWYTLELVHKDSTEYLTLQVLNKKFGGMAAAGAVLALLAAPELLIRKTRLVYLSGKRQVPVTGWIYLLIEPATGLSLARLQLILLFVPAAVVYLTLSFPLHQFPPMPDTVWQLLGLGGATAAVSTMITPSQNSNPTAQSAPSGPPNPATATAAALDPATTGAAPSTDEMAKTVIDSLNQQGAAALDLSSDAGRAALTDAFRQAAATPKATTAPAMAPTEIVVVRAPSTSDLFEESNGFGDISRYQSLVMCVATGVTFFVSFFDTWSVPALPPRVLELLGTSLGVYLSVKGINQVKRSNATKTAA